MKPNIENGDLVCDLLEIIQEMKTQAVAHNHQAHLAFVGISNDGKPTKGFWATGCPACDEHWTSLGYNKGNVLHTKSRPACAACLGENAP